MLAPTHVAVGYLCAAGVCRFAGPLHRDRWLRSRVLIVTMVFSILPDVDIVWMLIRGGRQMLGDQAGAHHAYVTHVPVFYLAGAAIATLLTAKLAPWWRWIIVAALLGALSHLVLDSFLIGWGVKWLYPWSEEFFGWNVVTDRYRAQWGDQWLIHYLFHPLALIEYVLIGAAIAVAWAKRRSKGRRSETFSR